MKKYFKETISVLLALLMVTTTISLLPLTVTATEETEESACVAHGTTGDCTWSVDNNGKLIISGNGAMADTPRPYYEPWHNCEINTVEISYGVTNIGAFSFYGCKSLKSIKISESVTSIGGCAFEFCSNLTNLTIPDSVTSIGNSAFIGCEKLKRITIPDSVTNIGKNSLSTGQDTIIYGKKDSYAEIYANDKDITFVYILGSGITGDCTWSLDDEGTLTIIGNGAMGNYKGGYGELAPWAGNNCCKVVIEEGVTNIGRYAFYFSINLTEIIIPNSVTSIGDVAFSNCVNLTRITIPNSVTSIGNSAFGDCTGLTSITIPNSVTSIGSYAFRDCTNLTSITIPNSVTSIGNRAFYECYYLTSITIPDSVTNIGEEAFSSCIELSSIIVDEKNVKYDSRNNCNAIIETESNCLIQGCNNTVIPNSVTSIGNRAFYECYYLTSITIPDSVTNIGEEAFSYCTNLTSITIPNSVTSIGNEAFHQCENLEFITIPNSVTSIGYQAFESTKWFENKSKGVIYAGDVAYAYKPGNNHENTSIELKKGTICIATGAFNDLEDLTKVTIPDTVKIISPGAFYGCNNLESITIPNSITGIGSCAFAYCDSLSEITIPGSVTKIGSYAFVNCSKLTNVTIPSSVKSIGKKAFGYSINAKVNDFTKFDDFANDENFERMDSLKIFGKNNSEAHKYAKENNFDNKDNFETIKYKFEWGKDNWQFDNEYDNFKETELNDSFYGVIDKLAPKFNMDCWVEDIKNNIFQIADGGKYSWVGMCFGMSVSEILFKQGLLKLNEYGKVNGNSSNQYLHDYSINNNIISVISFLQQLQFYGPYLQTPREETIKSNDTSLGNTPSQSDFIETIEEELKEDDSVIIIEYEFEDKNSDNNKRSEHAVLGYGIKNVDNTDNSEYKIYDKKILIADPNHLSKNNVFNDACIYYNSTDFRWICPYRKNDIEKCCYWNSDSDHKAKIKRLIKYNSLTDPVFYPKNTSYIAGITISNESGNETKLDPNSGIEPFNMENAPKNREFYALKDSTADCSFEYDIASNFSLMMDYENISYYANIKNGISTSMKPSGCINFTGDNANYSLTVLTDNSVNMKDWYSINVSGENANNVTLTKQKYGSIDGYLLDADNLQNVRITTRNDLKTENYTIGTLNEAQPLFIYRINSNNSIYVKTVGIEKDENGNYNIVKDTELTNADEVHRGDTDLDDDVTITDVCITQRFLAQLCDLSLKSRIASDANCDGEVDIKDCTVIQRFLAYLLKYDEESNRYIL